MERLATDYSNYQDIIRANWALIDPLRGESQAHGKIIQGLGDLVMPRQAQPVYESLISESPAQAAPAAKGLFGSLTVKNESTTQLPLNVFGQSASPTADTSTGKKGAVFHDILSL